MRARGYTDLLGGGLTFLIGLFTVSYAASMLSFGSLRQMGPGMFPAAIGGLLIIFGVIIFMDALSRPGPLPKFRKRTPLFVFGGVSVFALSVVPFGLIPAVCALTAISYLAERDFRPKIFVILCAVISLMAWLVYKVGLGLNVALFRWPF